MRDRHLCRICLFFHYCSMVRVNQQFYDDSKKITRSRIVLKEETEG